MADEPGTASTRETKGFEDLDVGHVGPVRTVQLSRTDLVRYAGASGDFNPMHHDELKATEAGMPSVFGQGMLSAGILAGAITDLVGLGTLRRYEVRFTKQAWPGRALRTEVRVTGKSARESDGLVELECRLLDDEDTVVLVASATAALPLLQDRRTS